MHDQWTIERLGELRGSPVYDAAGEKIGKVDEIYYDTQTRVPEWMSLGTGFFGSKHLLVPVEGADARDDGIYVRYSKEQVEDSPKMEEDEISPAYESTLYDYYGIGHSTRRSDTVLPDGGGGGYPARDDLGERELEPAASDERGTVTRTEEELHVGARPAEAGRVRLRKWVDTEPVEADVELTRERAHVQRERIDEPVSGHDFGEEEVEVPLHAEEPVVEKRAVAKERVSIGKRAESDTHTVTDTVRKERVDVDHDGVEDVDEID
jgi:uncharacterized protein (TIGR02271 family)